MKTIQLTIDEDLLDRVNQEIQQQKTTLAIFIRESLVHYLDKLNVKTMEKQQRDGYSKYPVQGDEFDVWENEQAWGHDETRRNSLV